MIALIVLLALAGWYALWVLACRALDYWRPRRRLRRDIAAGDRLAEQDRRQIAP